MPLQTGQMLNNRYRVVKLLGQGGFGAVYRAWDSNLNRPCAIKENLDVSPEAQRQFTREATVLANLSHPNLPRVTDHFLLSSQGQYLVMDFVEGDDLASILRQRGPIPVQQALFWISQVADALIYLHSRQPAVVHRDVKPANIRVTPEGRAMLVDFGLVKMYNPQLKTTLGARAVTPGYAPPEQYGQGSTDARSDIYALGATLYNILTGQEPMESVQRMSGAQMRPASQINPNVPVAVSQTLERAMQLQPTQRYQVVSDFKSALSQSGPLSIGRPFPETYPVPPVRSPALDPGLGPPSSKPVSSPTPKRNLGMMIGIGVAAVLCVVGGISAIGLIAASQSTSAEKTSAAELKTTLEDRVKKTSTFQAIGTGTARSQATEQSKMKNLEANKTLIFGPTSGNLKHGEGESIVAQDAGVNLSDFIVEAIFHNPFSASESFWDYGFLVRHETKNVHYRFVVQSDKKWILINNEGSPDGETIAQGQIPDLKVGAGESNKVKLVFQGDHGWFFLNDVLISELDLSARMNSGEIFIATGIFRKAQKSGEITNYSEFRIWSLP